MGNFSFEHQLSQSMQQEEANIIAMSFNPYTDRLARDIRNSLSSALVDELTGNTGPSLVAVASDWLATDPGTVYQTYIKNQLKLYHQAVDEIKARQESDPRYQAILLWNLGLFFELHELLETIWNDSREPERSALKGWIQAAAVYVHLHRGKDDIARRLARRAKNHLHNGRSCLEFISNLDRLIEALANPTDAAPKLLPLR